LDDDNIEVTMINNNTNIKGILFDVNWKEKCLKSIENGKRNYN